MFPTWMNLERGELAPDGRAGKYPQFNLAGLLRGDIKTRAAFYAMGRQWGWFSINDVRELEDMPDIGPDGDVYLSPMNMLPAGTDPADLLPGTSEDQRSGEIGIAAQRLGLAVSYGVLTSDEARKILDIAELAGPAPDTSVQQVFDEDEPDDE